MVFKAQILVPNHLTCRFELKFTAWQSPEKLKVGEDVLDMFKAAHTVSHP